MLAEYKQFGSFQSYISNHFTQQLHIQQVKSTEHAVL